MQWVKAFYEKQQAWTSLYTGEITDHHRQNVCKVQWLAGPPPLTLLELGAGGGQFARAAADRGYEVTAIELIDASFQHMKSLAKGIKRGRLTALQKDFYRIELPHTFDVVCYWDGFGLGKDGDQQRLLKRIYQWLEPHGCALIDVYTPWYWTQAAGHKTLLGSNIARCSDFDAMGCRMIDYWWPIDDPSQKVTQSLRCYSPADLRLLLQGTGLALEEVTPGGAYDAKAQIYDEQAPLSQAMSYVAKIRKIS